MKRNIGSKFALEHLAGKEQRVAFFFVANYVADRRGAERGGKFGDEVAHLVGVRHQDELGLFAGNELLERGDEGIGRIGFELCVLDGIDPGDFLRRDFSGDRGNGGPDDGGFERPAGFSG